MKESQDRLKELTKARYGDHDLEAKTFPHLHLVGGIIAVLYHTANAFDVIGWFASDQFYPFFRYDCMTKMGLRMNNARRVVRVGSLQESDAGKVHTQNIL